MFDFALKTFLRDIGREDIKVDNLSEEQKFLICREIATLVYHFNTGDFNYTVSRKDRNKKIVEVLGNGDY